MPYVDIPGARLNIADAGRIEASTLLFVHGNVMDLHMWDALVAVSNRSFVASDGICESTVRP